MNYPYFYDVLGKSWQYKKVSKIKLRDIFLCLFIGYDGIIDLILGKQLCHLLPISLKRHLSKRY
ncbi:MAG: hypothetical protein RLZZ176_1328 [Cyanobacteriota bacterium]|jgi:hypothetical protein